MKGIKHWFVVGVALALMTTGAFHVARADHDEDKEKSWYRKIFDWDNDDHGDNDHDREGEKRRYRKRHRNESEHHGNRYLSTVNNPTYLETCGACHFAYQPELLPSGSWDKILAGLDDHFGEFIEIDPDSKKIIGEYLRANGAERSPAKRAAKIISSLGGKTPLRITEIPYIKEKHHEIPSEVLKRESIGSLSNCLACHKTAEKGIYDDDSAVIPR